MFDLHSWLFPTPRLLHNHQSALTPNSCWSGGARKVTSGSICREFMSTEEMSTEEMHIIHLVSRVALEVSGLWYFLSSKKVPVVCSHNWKCLTTCTDHHPPAFAWKAARASHTPQQSGRFQASQHGTGLVSKPPYADSYPMVERDLIKSINKLLTLNF